MIDWGNVPSWLAFIAAGTAVMFTWRALSRERKRDADRHEDDRKKQAEQFGAWIGRDASAQSKFEGDFHIKFRNTSGLPVYDVKFRILNLRENSSQLFADELPLVAPAAKEQDYRLNPGTLSQLHIILQQSQIRKEPSVGYGLEVTFRDSAGRRWRRDTDGKLDELTDSTTA